MDTKSGVLGLERGLTKGRYRLLSRRGGSGRRDDGNRSPAHIGPELGRPRISGPTMKFGREMRGRWLGKRGKRMNRGIFPARRRYGLNVIERDVEFQGMEYRVSGHDREKKRKSIYYS